MAITKVVTIANLLDIPVSKCHIKQNDKNIVVVNNEKEYLVFSEKGYGNGLNLNVAVREWNKKIVWRYPIEFILKYSQDKQRGFHGIINVKLIEKLKYLQTELKEDFNELALSIIRNKTRFSSDAVREFGYAFIFKPIDDKEIVSNGFRIYRIK